jgi:hypothetical protein
MTQKQIMTHNQKVKIYSKLSKKDLIAMLIAANNTIDILAHNPTIINPTIVPYIQQPPITNPYQITCGNATQTDDNRIIFTSGSCSTASISTNQDLASVTFAKYPSTNTAQLNQLLEFGATITPTAKA